ncbi:MAG: MATE family efflux transporter [Phycisphaerales bacterium]|nr:MATE family efflux transporter [Phycisphaerales bacterium]
MSQSTDNMLPLEPAAAGSELRAVLKMVVPTVITMSARAMLDVVDFKLVTLIRDPQEAATAAAAILPAQMVVWCYIVLGMGTINLVSTYVSQSLGRGRPEECSAYGWQVLYLALLFGLTSLPFAPLLRGIIYSMPHAPQVLDREYAYASIVLWSLAPTLAAEGLAQFFNGVHRPWVTTCSALEANVINVAVGAPLMFGWFGIEPMGIEGPAWGTVASTSYRTLRLALTMLSPRMNDAYATRRTWRPSPRRMLDILRVGLPTGVQWFSDVFVWMFFVTTLVGRFGTVHQVATNTTWQYMRLSFMPTAGVGVALSSLVGKSIGRGDPSRATRDARTACAITLSYMGALTVLFLLAPRWLMHRFTQDPRAIDIGVGILACAAVFQLFDALAIVYLSALRGAGDTFWPSAFSIAAHWTIIMGGGWAAVTWLPQAESLGPWVVASALIVIIGVFFWLRWRSKRWMKIRLFREDRATTVPTGAVPEPAESPCGVA